MTAARPGPARSRLLAGLVAGLTLLGLVLAVLRPAWLTVPLQAAVEDAGAAAPFVFVLLCVLTAPLHLNGMLATLSLLVWPLEQAWPLSFVGSLLGCVLSAWALSRAGSVVLRQQESWPAWLERLATQVRRRPVLIGLAARVALGSGLALETFYLLTGYTHRQYLGVTVLGLAVWVTQALVGVTLLHALLQRSAGLAGLAVFAPLLLVGVVLLRRRKNIRPEG